MQFFAEVPQNEDSLRPPPNPTPKKIQKKKKKKNKKKEINLIKKKKIFFSCSLLVWHLHYYLTVTNRKGISSLFISDLGLRYFFFIDEENRNV